MKSEPFSCPVLLQSSFFPVLCFQMYSLHSIPHVSASWLEAVWCETFRCLWWDSCTQLSPCTLNTQIWDSGLVCSKMDLHRLMWCLALTMRPVYMPLAALSQNEDTTWLVPGPLALSGVKLSCCPGNGNDHPCGPCRFTACWATWVAVLWVLTCSDWWTSVSVVSSHGVLTVSSLCVALVWSLWTSRPTGGVVP